MYSQQYRTCEKVKEVGVDGILAVAPYYNRPTQEGMYQHFAQLATESGLPTIVYNVPARTGVDIATETIARLARLDHIVAIKQASDSASKLVEIAAEIDTGISLFAGDDPLVYFVMSLGGKGVISASANVIPELFVQIYEQWKSGNYEAAKVAQLRALPIVKALFSETNPAPVKAGLLIKELVQSDVLRLPLVSVSQETRARLKTLLSEVA